MFKSAFAPTSWRGLWPVVVGVSLGLAVLSPGAHAQENQAKMPTDDKMIVVALDQAMVLELPVRTTTIVIGNPGIVDATFLKHSNRVVLTGKSFGQTNVLALDASGAPVAQTQVRVASGPGALTVQLGTKRVSYSCTPRCEPTLQLGDDPSYAGQVASQAGARNGFAQGTGGAAGSGMH